MISKTNVSLRALGLVWENDESFSSAVQTETVRRY